MISGYFQTRSSCTNTDQARGREAAASGRKQQRLCICISRVSSWREERRPRGGSLRNSTETNREAAAIRRARRSRSGSLRPRRTPTTR